MNTFNSTGISSRQQHYTSKTRPQTDLSGPRLIQNLPKPKLKPPPLQHNEIEGPPSKRQRIDSPEAKHTRYAQNGEHSLSRNKNASPVDSTVRKPSLASEYGFDEPGTNGTRQNSVRHTALRDINSQPPVPKGSRTEIRKGSPVATRNTTNGIQDGASFMKGARRERESRVTDSDEEVSYQGKSTKTTRTLSSSTLGEDSTKAPKAVQPVSKTITPPTAKMISRLQESPDILQSSMETSMKSLKKIASPSRSPPTSRTGKKFPLKRLICAALPLAEAKAYEIEVDKKGRCFSIHYQYPDLTIDVVAGPIDVPKIIQILFSTGEDVNLVMLKFSVGVSLGRQCFLDFGDSTKTLTDFLAMIQTVDPSIKTIEKPR